MRTASQASQMVIIPDFTAMADDLTFTLGTIGFSSFTAMTMEEVRIRSALITSSPTLVVALTMLATASTTLATSPTTPITRCSLPCYQGRQIDNADLLGAIDQIA
jgi:hypothetical protein